MLGTGLSTSCPLNPYSTEEEKGKQPIQYHTQTSDLIQTQILNPALQCRSRPGKTRGAPESVLAPKDLTLQLEKEI